MAKKVSSMSMKAARSEINSRLRSGKTSGKANRARMSALSNRVGSALVYNRKGNITGHAGGGGNG